jgi:hypothetical protein
MFRGKRLDSGTLVSALVITGLIFFSGFFIGYGLNTEKLSAVETEMASVTRDIQNFQLQFLLFDMLGEKAACPLLSSTLSEINTRSDGIAKRLENVNADSEVMDYQGYAELKKEYSRVLLGYWLLANKFKEACDSKISTVVYFYAKGCDTCGDQSFVLTYLKRRHEENLLVFALDTDLDEPGIKTIKEYYNVSAYPTLVVNGVVMEGFQNTDTLEAKIGATA